MRRTGDLVEILGLVYGLFPECQRVTCYASPTSLQIKSEDELRLLRSKGLQMVYMGLESGCDAVLEKMQKGHTAAEIVAAVSYTHLGLLLCLCAENAHRRLCDPAGLQRRERNDRRAAKNRHKHQSDCKARERYGNALCTGH